jgi:hypothetical protein
MRREPRGAPGLADPLGPMAEPPVAAPKPCCVCDEPGGKHCTKCKSRHYCSKACQLVDWKRGHNKACEQLTTELSDRLLDTLMPEKLKIKEAPAIVEDVSPADGAKAGLPAARAPKTGEAIGRRFGLARRVRHLPEVRAASRKC